MAKKACASCGEGFLGRSGASYCSAACKQRAHRASRNANRNGSPSNVTVSAVVTQTSATGQCVDHSAEALALLASLDAELRENSDDRGLSGEDALSWSAAERAVLELVADAVDRQVDLRARYLASPEDKARVKLSTELRLIETNIARLLKQVKTDLPEPPSRISQKASRAAYVRWQRGTN